MEPGVAAGMAVAVRTERGGGRGAARASKTGVEEGNIRSGRAGRKKVGYRLASACDEKTEC
jgi:hypothetical protein